MSGRTLAYRKVYEMIKGDILGSRYGVGSLMPTEAELEAVYGVSRSTVRKAMELLAAEGYVDIRQGRGTLVKDFSARQDYTHVNSVTETLKKRGYEVTTRRLHLEKCRVPERAAGRLALQQSDWVVHVQRIQEADGNPVCFMENYIPYHLAEGLEKETGIVSLYRFLEENYGFEIERTKDVIAAATADFYEAEILSVPVGTAMLQVERVCYSPSGEPICLDYVRILGSYYQVEMEGFGRNRPWKDAGEGKPWRRADGSACEK